MPQPPADQRSPGRRRASNAPGRAAIVRLLAAALAAAAAPAAALAERADRTKPLTIDADKSGTLDLGKKIITYVGNVVVAQGSLAIRAERVELRELADGRRVATAIGVAGRPATFRQKRDGLDETIEGTAERIEYDDRSDTVRFVGAAAVKRLRGAATADEISGSLITYDNLAEVFVVQGRSSLSPDGRDRVRAVFTPQDDKAGNAKNGKDASQKPNGAPQAPSSQQAPNTPQAPSAVPPTR